MQSSTNPPEMGRARLSLALLLLCAILLSACSSHLPIEQRDKRLTQIQRQIPLIRCSEQGKKRRQINPSRQNIIKNLGVIFQKWEGTPYRYGGQTRRGIDCSAFTQQVYQQLFAICLPRTTRGQIRTGRYIPRNKLHPGDLIFFQIGKGGRHVGIYTGRGKFIHASSSRGVMQSSLARRYWQKRYLKARTLYRTSGIPRISASIKKTKKRR
ncbi:C40 family peptidase [Desulfotalea psychrophila]|uniref:Related to lipoprotein n=1 Tax=Desulfotalea psychrophila (strain LSv54 / DSM 12343) TaxID=177439 RepID=Q6AML6_DESPS|nr:related to lipoprotein [Desulfotalea psychrophila LSv54]